MSKPMPIRITVAGNKGSQAKLRPFMAMGEEFLDGLDKDLEKAADQISDIAEMTSPFKTGRLSENHYVKRVRRFVYQVHNRTPYAFWVHDGTRWMAPRPWLKNAHDDVTEGLLSQLKFNFTRGNQKLSTAEAEQMLFGGGGE